MTENERQIFARLTVYEAVLVSALAQAWGSVPEHRAQILAAEFVLHFRTITLTAGTSPESAEADGIPLALDTFRFAEGLAEKVLDRARQVRAATAG